MLQFQHIPKNQENEQNTLKCLVCNQTFDTDEKEDFMKSHRKYECSGKEATKKKCTEDTVSDSLRNSVDIVHESTCTEYESIYIDNEIIDSGTMKEESRQSFEDDDAGNDETESDYPIDEENETDNENQNCIKIEPEEVLMIEHGPDKEDNNVSSRTDSEWSSNVEKSAHKSISDNATPSTSSNEQNYFEESKFRKAQIVENSGATKTVAECIGCDISFHDIDSEVFKKHQ